MIEKVKETHKETKEMNKRLQVTSDRKVHHF